MTKTKITLTGLALTITLLISSHAWADIVTFEFISTGSNYSEADSVAEKLKLTAKEKEDGTGVDFRFTSDWNGGASTVNGGRGNIFNLYYTKPGYRSDDEASVYFHNLSDVFNSSPGLMQSNPSITARSGNFEDLGQDVWGMDFSLNYGNGGNWTEFLNALWDDAYFQVFIGNLGGGTGDVEIATFQGTAAAPEPATLAVLGLGLAGVGFASRRRRK